MKAIFFDFGNVLVFFDHMKSCNEFAKYSSKSADDIYQMIFGSKLEDREYNCGMYSDTQWYEYCIRLMCLRDISYERFAEIWGDIFTPNHKINGVIEALRPDLKRLVLSNTNGLHWAWAQKNLPILNKYFSQKEQIILSSEEKCKKPEKMIYDRALVRAWVKADEVVFIDDKQENLDAFRKMGGNAIHYDANSSSISGLYHQLDKYGCLV